jgi:hypothetical protein
MNGAQGILLEAPFLCQKYGVMAKKALQGFL